MLFSRDYRQPFWHGFFHALLVAVYVLFLALLINQLEIVFQGGLGTVIRYSFLLFMSVVSIAITAALIFYEPIKKLLHHHFRAATVMMLSTLGWLFIFLIIFLFGLVMTLG